MRTGHAERPTAGTVVLRGVRPRCGRLPCGRCERVIYSRYSIYLICGNMISLLGDRHFD